MPKSRVRKKKVYTPPTELRPSPTAAASKKPSPTWVPVLAVTLITVGILWLVAFYLSNGFFDMPEALGGGADGLLAGLGYWNLGIGFGALVASLLVLSRWR
ncbi:MAG: cell division protein CrgA [Micromonosporaceae bacterium]